MKKHFATFGLPITAFAVLQVWGISMSFSNAEPAAKSSEKKLRHVVMYRFKPETTAEQIQEVVEAFSGLPGKVDTIIGYEHGTNVSEEGKSDGLTHAFVVTFRDKAGLQTYLKHPAHDDYVKVVKDRREKVVVFDYWAD